MLPEVNVFKAVCKHCENVYFSQNSYDEHLKICKMKLDFEDLRSELPQMGTIEIVPPTSDTDAVIEL